MEIIVGLVFVVLFVLIFRSLTAFFAKDESSNESKESTDVTEKPSGSPSPFTMTLEEALAQAKKGEKARKAKEAQKLGERHVTNEALIYYTLFGTEAKAKRSLIVIACLLFFLIFIYVPWQTGDEPKNYDDCILKNIKASQTNGAVYEIKRACRNKFPKK